jgi:hypothetical protein
MAKIEMLCPFSQRLCDECPLYRGRHYFLCFCKDYRGYIGKSRGNIRPGTDQHEVDFKTLWKQLEPRLSHKVEAEPKIKLKVIDMETGKARFCELDEAKTWDWDNPEIMRMAGGYIHITSWDMLVEFAARRAEKGYQEMDVYEGPRFMMLAGG